MPKALFTLLLCSLTSGAFAATEVSHRRFRDETARVEYSWIENCTSKQLTVTAAKTKVKEDGVTVDVGPSVSVVYTTQTFCDQNNPEQTFWFGTATNATLDIDSNLRSAQLIAGSVVLQGWLFRGMQNTDLGTKTVSVSVNWLSDDPLDKYSGTTVTQYPGYHEVNHLTGHYRLATATGSISDGVQNWFPAQSAEGLVRLYRLNSSESILNKN